MYGEGGFLPAQEQGRGCRGWDDGWEEGTLILTFSQDGRRNKKGTQPIRFFVAETPQKKMRSLGLAEGGEAVWGGDFDEVDCVVVEGVGEGGG